jgi:hypothetical protein
MTQPFIKLRSATEHCESHGGGVHTAAQNLNPNVRAELSEAKGAQTNADTVTQFTAQVDRFLTSPHVNEPEAVRRFLAAVDPRCYESALDVACGPRFARTSVRAARPRVRRGGSHARHG